MHAQISKASLFIGLFNQFKQQQYSYIGFFPGVKAAIFSFIQRFVDRVLENDPESEEFWFKSLLLTETLERGTLSERC